MQDAVIIGGGPAGSFTALELAKRGFNTAVFEEHKNIGVPSHCAGHLSIQSLRNLDLYPLPKDIQENVFSAANFYSAKGTEFSVHLKNPVTCSVNRILFDRYLAEKAKSAGAELILGKQVRSLLLKEKYVIGVNVARSNGEQKQVQARLVVDAEGISSRILRQTGLKALRGNKMVYAVEAEVENIKDIEGNAVEVYLGKDYAMDFYGWLIPRLNGTAKVGLATKKGNPKECLQRLLQKHPGASKHLRNCRIKQMTFHSISLGGPIKKAYSNGFLAVGDCASQVKPTTGGGVIYSMFCAKIAAEVAYQSLKNKDFSEKALGQYQKRIDETLGFDMKIMLRARQTLDSFSDGEIDRALNFAKRIKLDASFRNIEEIDFQGRTLLTMLKKPASYAMFAYMLALHFLANA